MEPAPHETIILLYSFFGGLFARRHSYNLSERFVCAREPHGDNCPVVCLPAKMIATARVEPALLVLCSVGKFESVGVWLDKGE